MMDMDRERWVRRVANKVGAALEERYRHGLDKYYATLWFGTLNPGDPECRSVEVKIQYGEGYTTSVHGLIRIIDGVHDVEREYEDTQAAGAAVQVVLEYIGMFYADKGLC